MTDYLSKFKPDISVIDEFALINPDYSESDLAFYAYNQVLLVKKTQEVLFLALGRLLKEIRDRKLYLHLDYDNFSQFCASEEISFSREKAYMYIRVYEFYIDWLRLKEDDMKNFDLARLAMMIPILKKIEGDSNEEIKQSQVEKLEEMGALRYNDFVNEVNVLRNSDRPSVSFDSEMDKWIVRYYQDRTELIDRGEYELERTAG
jgi:hypothetical protein